MESWLAGTPYSFVCCHGTKHSAGVAILFSNVFSLVETRCLDGGRFVQAQLSSRFETFSICSIYAPNQNAAKHTFFLEVTDYFNPSVPTLVLGDFNSVFRRDLDRSGASDLNTSRDSSQELSDLFKTFSVVDIWRLQHPSEKSFTCANASGLISSRLDVIGVPESWASFTQSSSIVPCPFSDHCAVLANITLPAPVEHGPSFWKLNTSLLEDEGYIRLIQNFWARWSTQRNDFSSVQVWWDLGKSWIKQLSIQFSSHRAKQNRALKSQLEQQIANLKTLVDQGQADVLPRYKAALDRLSKIHQEEARGLQVRARTQWAEEGETSTSFFFRQVKHLHQKSTIYKIENDSGALVSSTPDMLDAWREFYSCLFTRTATDADIQNILLTKMESKLEHHEAESCEGPLTLEELLTAVKAMARNKTPGLDGLPMEFYLKFWETISSDLHLVLNTAHLYGTLSTSQKRGVISLVPKKGNLSLRKNWRPITLLNVDYKIASRAISARLLRVLSSIIAPDQTGSVPGRFIGETVVLLQNIVDYASERDIASVIVSLDQEKAFDRVDWPFLIRTLETLGFGPSFIRWVRTFYHKVESSVQVNGFLTPFFQLSRGVRQGCPLSPLLYVISAEVLACNIRACPRIKGFPLPGSPPATSVINQYADDTTLTLVSDDSIKAAFKIYGLYESASGAKLNQTKSKGLWLGPWSGRTDPPVQLLWTSIKIPCLGVWIGPGVTHGDNWGKRLGSLNTVFDLWQQRCLSYQGKALVANALALSGLWYTATVCCLPPNLLKEAQASVFKFFWSGKKELVRRASIVLGKPAGGFGVVHVEAKIRALHIQWVKRFILTPNKWCRFLSFAVSQHLGVDLMEVLSFPAYYSPHALPAFFSSMLESWALLGGFGRNGTLFLPADSEGNPRQLSACTTKLTYNILLECFGCPPHCIEKFLPVYGHLYWEATWKQLHAMPLDRHTIDVNWKIAHGVIYTADRLFQFGMDVDRECFCGSNETLVHLFFECRLMQDVLNTIQRVFRRAVAVTPVLEARHLLFGFSPDECEAVPPVFSYVLNLAKFQVWLARNDQRFRGTRPNHHDILASVKNRLDFHLSIFSKRFRSDQRKRRFRRAWNVLGKFWPNPG